MMSLPAASTLGGQMQHDKHQEGAQCGGGKGFFEHMESAPWSFPAFNHCSSHCITGAFSIPGVRSLGAQLVQLETTSSNIGGMSAIG